MLKKNEQKKSGVMPSSKKTFAFGVTEKLVRKISKSKNEPNWMLKKRLDAFYLWEKTPMPDWGPDLSRLDLDKMIYYTNPLVSQKSDWADLPEEISKTFDKLGIPKAEKEFFGGVGAQYDSNIVYHKIKKSLSDKGIIFENMDVAVQKYPELVKKYFMTKCISAKSHKFASLHGAVWSGGTFVYVPKNVDVGMPLQAYFRMNLARSGQFEHTLIVADEGSNVEYIEACSAPKYNYSSLHTGGVELWVMKNAKIKYSSIENWSKNTYNLNTKTALVFEDGTIEWLNGNIGSHTTMLYPASILMGKNARSESTGVVMAGKGQNQDTGTKVIHIAPNTSSIIYSKSISKDGGISQYRGLVKVLESAKNSRVSVDCDALIIGKNSKSNTLPVISNVGKTATIVHEARIGKIGEVEIYYLQTRGFSEKESIKMLVGGFIDPVIKALPMEYAVELNKLVDIEME